MSKLIINKRIKFSNDNPNQMKHLLTALLLISIANAQRFERQFKEADSVFNIQYDSLIKKIKSNQMKTFLEILNQVAKDKRKKIRLMSYEPELVQEAEKIFSAQYHQLPSQQASSKSLDECKQEIAERFGYDDWEEYTDSPHTTEMAVELAKLYASQFQQSHPQDSGEVVPKITADEMIVAIKMMLIEDERFKALFDEEYKSSTPASESLEQASKDWASKNYHRDGFYINAIQAFKKGAEWQSIQQQKPMGFVLPDNDWIVKRAGIANTSEEHQETICLGMHEMLREICTRLSAANVVDPVDLIRWLRDDKKRYTSIKFDKELLHDYLIEQSQQQNKDNEE